MEKDGGVKHCILKYENQEQIKAGEMTQEEATDIENQFLAVVVRTMVEEMEEEL